MKVSKIILASLLGAVAINSVMADEYDGPRNRCKSKLDKYWVESTKTCVPKNPCGGVEYNKDYCFKHAFSGTELQVRLFHKKYIEQVLQSVISEALPEVESYAENDERHFYPYALQDGGYFVLMGDTRMDVDHYSETKLITGACLAYGVKPSRYSCDEVDSENKCTEIADFASELTQKSCNGALEASECKITCD